MDESLSTGRGKVQPGTIVFWLLVMSATAGICGVIFLLPAQYRATSLVLVEPPRPPMTLEAPSLPIEQVNRMVAEQMARVRADDCLIEALKSLDVRDTEWFRTGIAEGDGRAEELLNQLKAGLRVRQVPQTNYMEVSFAASRPEDAASIVNAVVTKYLAEVDAAAKTRLRREWDKYRNHCVEKLNALRSRRQFRNEFVNSQFRTPGVTTDLNIPAEQFRSLSEAAARLESAKLQAKARYEALKECTDPGRSPEVQAALDRDAIVGWLRQELLSGQVELESMLLASPDNEAAVKQLEKRLKVLQDKLSEVAALREKAEAARLAQAAEAEYLSAVQAELQLRERLEAVEAVLADNEVKRVEYENLTYEVDLLAREYEQLQAFTNQLGLLQKGESCAGIRQVGRAQKPTEPEHGLKAAASAGIAAVPLIYGFLLIIARTVRSSFRRHP